MKKHFLIGLTGAKQSGKSTVASMMTFRWPIHIIGFGDAVKKELSDVLDIPLNEWDTIKKRPEGRAILQLYGTEYRRGQDFLYWVRKLDEKLHRVMGNAVIVIPDVRFLNEANYVVDKGGIIIRIRRDSAEVEARNDKHQSEKEMFMMHADYEIDNCKCEGRLRYEVNTMCKKISLEYNIQNPQHPHVI